MGFITVSFGVLISSYVVEASTVGRGGRKGRRPKDSTCMVPKKAAA